MPLSIYHEAVGQVDCPWCNAKAGDHCQTPKGRKAYPPHNERCDAVVGLLGANAFKVQVTNATP